MLRRSEDNRKVGAEIRQEAGCYNDILQFNFTDNYQNLIIKVLSQDELQVILGLMESKQFFGF